MKRTAALRVAGEICFFYSVLTLFPVFQPWRFPMAGFALACLLVAFIAVGLRSAPLRFLLSLLPAACFLFSEMSWLLVFPALAWLYFILLLTLGRFEIPLYNYRLAFRWMFLVGVFLIAIQSFNYMLFDGKGIPIDSMVYLFAYLLLSVIAMRGMQMGAGMDSRWHMANALTVAATLILAFAVSLALYQLYRHSIPLLAVLFSPLKRLLEWLFGLIRFRAVQEEGPRSTPPLETPKVNFFVNAPLITDEEGLHIEEPERTVSGRVADQVLSIGAFLILAFLLVIAIWLVVKLVRRGKAFAEEGVDYEQTEAFLPERGRRKARQETVHGPAQTVRKIYREYLAYLEENGLRRSASDTSAEILAESERISAVSASAEETLRSVYLKARYSAAKISDEDVAAARASLNAIRSRERPDG